MSLGTTINGNDNYRYSWVTMGGTKNNEKYIPFIPYADKLIQSYSKSWWKNHPESWDYQIAHFTICGFLWCPQHSKEWTLRFLARPLEIEPIIFMNYEVPELASLPLTYNDAKAQGRFKEDTKLDD